MALPVGSKAPDFTLKTVTPEGMKDVTLSDNFGKTNTVLLFFPGAFTGVCTQEMCMMRDDIGRYRELNAEVYGISVDSAFAQQAWKEKEGLNFSLLSDYEHKVTQLYDVVLPSLAGLGPSAQRAAFVIDREGVIRYSEQTPVPTELPDFDAVKAALAELE